MSDVKKAPVLMVTKATETFDTLMALKKKIQWVAMIIPVIRNLINPFLSTKKDFFLIKKNNKMNKTAKLILKNTKGIASIVMSAPKIAVKPQIKTIK